MIFGKKIRPKVEEKKKEEPKAEEPKEPPKVEEKEPKAEPAKPRTIGDQMREEGLMVEPEMETEKPVVEKKGLTEVIMRIDKLEGKLEMSTEAKNAMDEKLSGLSEQLGDVRRMVLDREKTSSALEANFDKVKIVVEDLDPGRITRRFEKFEGEIEKQTALLEKMNITVERYNERIKKIEDQFETIKSFKNLVKISETINQQAKDMDANKKYTDRMAAKVESIFSDMNEKLAHIRTERETIAKLDELVTDMMKDVDKIKFKLESETLKKDQLDTVKSEIIKQAKGITPERFEDMVARIEKIELEKHSIDELEKERDDITKLLLRAEKDYKDGKLTHESYDEFRTANDGRLSRINAIIEFLSKKMLYEKVKAESQRLEELLAKFETVPKREEFDLVRKESDHVEAMLEEIGELKKQMNAMEVTTDRLYVIERSLDQLKNQMSVATELKKRIDELAIKRGELEEKLERERLKLTGAEGNVGKLSARLEESFRKILMLEEEIDDLERQRTIPIDVAKMRTEILEIRTLLEDTRVSKAEKKELEQFEARIESFIERYADIIKKIAEKD